MLVVILISPGAGPDANELRRVTAPSSEVNCCDPLCAGQSSAGRAWSGHDVLDLHGLERRHRRDVVYARGYTSPDLRGRNYQNLAWPLLIVPDRIAFRTSSMVVRPPGAEPPHANRVAAGVQ